VDVELIRQAQQGDAGAYEQLARGLAPRLFRVAYRIMRDADAAQDAMQQALIAMWRELPTLRDLDAFETWTWRLITNAATSEIRRDRRRFGAVRDVGLDAQTGERLRALPDASLAIGDRDVLERAFAELTPDQRAVVVLRYYVGLSLEEIAQAVRVPYGTAASRMHYAMRALRTAIETADRTATEVRSA
jgi:RNA polymerase sigma-70 factor, ECF subfamily